MTWRIEFLNAVAKAELDRLPLDVRAKFERIVELIQAKGLEQVREPYVKHLEDRLWEMHERPRRNCAIDLRDSFRETDRDLA